MAALGLTSRESDLLCTARHHIPSLRPVGRGHRGRVRSVAVARIRGHPGAGFDDSGVAPRHHDVRLGFLTRGVPRPATITRGGTRRDLRRGTGMTLNAAANLV